MAVIVDEVRHAAEPSNPHIFYHFNPAIKSPHIFRGAEDEAVDFAIVPTNHNIPKR